MTSKPLAEALEEAFEHCRDMDASLNTRLQALADAVRTLSPSFAEAVDRLVSRLQQSGAGPSACIVVMEVRDDMADGDTGRKSN